MKLNVIETWGKWIRKLIYCDTRHRRGNPTLLIFWKQSSIILPCVWTGCHRDAHDFQLAQWSPWEFGETFASQKSFISIPFSSFWTLSNKSSFNCTPSCSMYRNVWLKCCIGSGSFKICFDSNVMMKAKSILQKLAR